MQVRYEFTAKQHGVHVSGLEFHWRVFKRFGTSESMLRYAPKVADLGHGYYGISWDIDIGGEVSGDVYAIDFEPDGGPIEIEITKESPIILKQEKVLTVAQP